MFWPNKKPPYGQSDTKVITVPFAFYSLCSEPRLNALQTDQEYPDSSVSKCKPICPQRYAVTFTREASTSSPLIVGATMQYITSLYCHVRHILANFLLLFPRLQRSLKGHLYADIQRATTKQPFRKCFPGLLQRLPETLEAVY